MCVNVYLYTHTYVSQMGKLLHIHHPSVVMHFNSIALTQADSGKLDLQINLKCVLFPSCL